VPSYHHHHHHHHHLLSGWHLSRQPADRAIRAPPIVSGLSAAHTIYLAGGNVVVLDKQGFFGGNSTKATSGINGALTRTQVEHGIQDSVKQFYDDTLKSARDKARPDLIKVLTYKSAAAVEWLQDVFNLDLTLVSRLGYVYCSPCARRNCPAQCTDPLLLAAATRSPAPTVATMPSSPAWPSPTP